MPDTALVVSATVPDPPDTGKRVVLRGLLRYLVDRLGPGNVHYALVGAAGSRPLPFPVTVHHLDRPGVAAQVGALTRCLTDGSYTLQEAMLGSRELGRQVAALVDELDPRIEVYDTLRMGQHAPTRRTSRRRVLYVDDLFSVRYARMLAVARRESIDMDPLGGFVENVPARVRWLARRRAVYLPLLRVEGRRLERKESEVVRDFDVSLLVNADEVELLRARSGIEAVEAFPPLLPPVAAAPRAQADPPEIVFLGNLGLPHNDDAVCSFLRTTMPALTREYPGVRLRVIGRNASPALRAAGAAFPQNVVLEGFVADLDSVLAKTTAVIAPLRFGSGVKIKMLEALARGVPLLATSCAAEGIPVRQHGLDGCLVSDDLTSWPGLIAGLADRTRNAELSAAASAFFDRTYGDRVVTAQYDAVFGLHPVV